MRRTATAFASLTLLLAGCGPFATYDVRRPLVIEAVPKAADDVAEFASFYRGTDRKALETSLRGAQSARKYFDIYKRDEGTTYLQLDTLASALEKMKTNPYAW